MTNYTYKGLTVRTRTVTTRTATGPHRGPEVQVIGPRGRVLARFDFTTQAEAWIDRKANT